ncbi:hypothetical protein SLEP1_g45969 [Rubroshorea leprosula]|uniref:Uncharacterized protein n=1 Tax=Rubroshorea leprosula TaxID=152421 RepID=A0AAV5LKQ8_9ROSI|nr:hypothetical protein SLEP1_g45969 [Rubroshorea leprosula]
MSNECVKVLSMFTASHHDGKLKLSVLFNDTDSKFILNQIKILDVTCMVYPGRLSMLLTCCPPSYFLQKNTTSTPNDKNFISQCPPITSM